jgi:16S rRNA (guanine(966)-N(2))-methyltransferase RsmD
MRIVAGRYGGRRLVAPRGSSTRPTGERVREALFAVLGHEVAGARVLDLYAGTGALGLEALSRGAGAVVFVESAGPALDAIRSNVATLGAGEQTTLVAGAAERLLGRLEALGPFDLVIADPPWARIDDAVALLATLTARGLSVRDATFVLEHSSADAPKVPGLAIRWQRNYGDTGVSIFEQAAEP